VQTRDEGFAVNTEELINTLVADHRVEALPGQMLWRSMLAPVVAAAVLLLVTAGVRVDFAAAVTTPRLLFKFAVALSLLIATCGIVLRLSRPDGRPGGWAVVLLMVLGLLLAGVMAELLVSPSDSWGARMRGTNAMWCLRMIPMLSALPLAACLLVLRRAAPTQGARAGAAAGLFSAAIGASLYALHCTDDSPLFVAAWYGLAACGITAIGAALGARLLRW
jgi:hypothetical protein